MDQAPERVIELIFGRWRSQILYAGADLGVFDALADGPRTAAAVAGALSVDADLLYRLMRALGSLELLREAGGKTFSLTPLGDLLRRDHPYSLRAMATWEEGPLPYAAWKPGNLSSLIKEGKRNAFVTEFGEPLFDYLAQHPAFGTVFNEAMSSYSAMDNALVLEALESYDFSGVSHLCDVAGGHGSTLCHLLAKYSHLKGTVLDLPRVVEQKDLLWAERMGVGNRCDYIGRDMFQGVPVADAYMMKRILHDWSDEESVQILSTAHKAAVPNARVFVIEAVVPGPDTPHFAKLFDLHMLIMLTGRERTTEEYAGLLEAAGWKYQRTWFPASHMLGIVEGVKA